MRLIDADDAIECIKAGMQEDGNYESDAEHIIAFINLYAKWHQITAHPIGHAYFVDDGNDFYGEDAKETRKWRCSNCNHSIFSEEQPRINYCPNCGAEMSKEET